MSFSFGEKMRKRIIYCPDCARELFRPGLKQTIKVTVRCGCGNYYIVDPVKMVAVMTIPPEIKTSSGARFY